MSRIKVAVVMSWYAPYRVPLLRDITRREDIDLTVIFCSKVEAGRSWSVPDDLPFNAVFLKSRTLIRYKFRHMFGDDASIRYPIGLFHAVRSVKPDVLVAYEFRLECVLAAFYALLHRCAYVTWSDVTENHDSRMGRVRRAIRKVLLSRSKALIGSSSDTLGYFHRTFGYPSERSFLSVLSAHIDDFVKSAPQTSFTTQRPDGKVYFLYVGGLIPRKGVDLLITAFSALKHKLPHAHLTLVGDGPERYSLEDLAIKLGCNREVIFKNYITHDQLSREMKLHDVFVFPTRLDTFGLVVAEAVACGLPVICSCWAGAARDLVEDNGIVVNPLDINALSSAMQKLASDPNLRLRMRHAGQAVLQKHNLMTAVEGFLNALHVAALVSV